MRDNAGGEVTELKSDSARVRKGGGGDKDSKKGNFFKLLDAVFENTVATGGRSKNLSAEAMMLWWNSVKEFPMEMIRRALAAYMESESGKYMPTPSEIRAILKTLSGISARPGGDEAWSMIPISERESAVITDEMMEAMLPAQILINRGDTIGARMAFKSAYERIVSTNILIGKLPRWVPSFGWDPGLRVNALAQAVLSQKVSLDTAVSFLEAPADREMLYEQTGATHLLPPPQTPEQKAAVNALLDDLKKRLM